MDNLVFDAGPLITVCRFRVSDQPVIDHILNCCRVTIATSVHDEVVVAGAHYPDARMAQQRIEEDRIAVLSPSRNPDLEMIIGIYGLGNGERDTLLLADRADLQDPGVVIDDHLAYLVSDRLGKRKRFLLDVIVDLVKTGRMPDKLATDIVEAIRSRYPPAFVKHTMLILRS